MYIYLKNLDNMKLESKVDWYRLSLNENVIHKKNESKVDWY